MRHRFWIVLALAAFSALPGSGASPRVTLKLKQATVTEACAALSSATGVKVAVEPFPGTPPPPEAPSQRADFDWRQATLPNVLRDLSDRFGAYVGPARDDDGFRLTLVPGRRAGPRALPVGVFESRGVRLSVAAIATRANRSLTIEGESGGPSTGSTEITLSCRSETMDRAAYAGVENLVARDDMGNLLVPTSEGRDRTSYSNFPDEVFLRGNLTATHPRATKLAWLEGEVITYRSLVPATITFPLGPGSKQEPVMDGEVNAELVGFSPGEQPDLRVRFSYPRGVLMTTLGVAGHYGPFPELIGASGKTYASNQYSGSGEFDPDLTIMSGRWRFNAVPEPVTAARFRLLLKSDPQPHFRFRSTDIPLPAAVDGPKHQSPSRPNYDVAKPESVRRIRPLGLNLKRVTAQEAAAQLAKASGEMIEVSATELPTDRQDYDWSRLTWPEALRDLKKRYEFATSRGFTGGIKLDHSFTIPPPIVPKRRVEFIRDGIRVALQGVYQSAQHQRTFTPPADSQSHVGMSVSLAVRTGPIEPRQYAGIANVRAVDDRNRELRESFPSLNGLSMTHLHLPDALQANARLTHPSPEARSLKSLEGDLLVYRDFGQLRVAFDAPVTSATQKRSNEFATFELSGSVPRAGGKRLFALLKITPKDPQIKLGDLLLVPIGESGRRYGLSSAQGGGLGGNEGAAELNVEFADIPEAIDRVEALATWQARPERLFRFRLENLPLPAEPAFEPARLPAGAPKAAPDRSTMPLYDPKGGHLVFSVRLAGAPAPEGILRAGLMAKDGPLRWFDLPVGADGAARLEATKPGNYRVLQTYRPNKAPETASRGRWFNAEAAVQVRPGKTVNVPLLNWVER